MADKIGAFARQQLDMQYVIDVTGLTYKAKHDDNLQPDPADAKYRVALVGCYVDSHETGGSDKVSSGHRFDTVGIANGLKHAGVAVQIIFYNVDEHDKFFEVVSQFDAIVMRINPGQITANGGDQQKFDSAMTQVAENIPVWPTPANMELMGAKDALTKIKDMPFGLPDTLGYYSPDEIKEGFPKTIAFQKRVVKQNRGSAGEGIWIIDLKEGNYCKEFESELREWTKSSSARRPTTTMSRSTPWQSSSSGARTEGQTSLASGRRRARVSISRAARKLEVRW